MDFNYFSFLYSVTRHYIFINQSLPQIISRVHNVMYKVQLNGSLSRCCSRFWTRILACSFITSRKSTKIVKWKVGVNIFLLVCHFFPVLQNKEIKIIWLSQPWSLWNFREIYRSGWFPDWFQESSLQYNSFQNPGLIFVFLKLQQGV